jgi:hypothetical protein
VRRAALALAAVALSAAPARAQDARRLVGGVEYRAMAFDSGLSTQTKTVTVLSMPFGVVWNASRRLSLDVGTRFASATREAWDSVASATISGLTDTQARLVYQVAPDLLVLTVSANLPTGKSTITGEQLDVASAIAHDLIPYPVSSFGSGTSVTTGLAFAVPVGGWALGIGGSYRVSGTYQLFTGVADTNASAPFRPGAEIRARVGLDRVVGQGRVALGLTYSSFAVDELGDQQVLRPGKRWLSQASLSFPVGNVGFALYGWNLYRTAGSEVASGAATERQNLLVAGLGATILAGRRQIRPSFEYRRHWADDSQGALGPAGALLSAGLRVLLPVGERFALLPAARFDTGNVANETSGENVAVTGFSGGITLRMNW